MEEVRGARQSEVIFTQKYRINVGDDHKPVIAQVTDLYTFHRVDTSFVSRNPSLADDTMTPPSSAKRKYNIGVFLLDGKANAQKFVSVKCAQELSMYLCIPTCFSL